MKGRSAKPYSSKTLLNAWRQLLEDINRIKADPACDLDPEAVANVTDYLLDRIDAYRPVQPARSTEKACLKMHRLPPRDNRPDNQAGSGGGND
ncbi:hypothetical protein ACFPPA_08760 [Rhodanobacter ginsengisoli]|uniref:Uncharacterized protein n=1 Tax=Rhodanobacter ginsengisoli TaxID=418646 RepID=A0ABW0QME3_9GAMM